MLRVKGKQYQKLKTWVDLTHFLMGKYTTWRQSIVDNKAKKKKKKKREVHFIKAFGTQSNVIEIV